MRFRARTIYWARAAVAALLACGAVAVPVIPALASATFQVTVNGSAEVTRYPLTAGQKFTCGGVEYTVQTVQGGFGTYIITTTPRLAASAACSV